MFMPARASALLDPPFYGKRGFKNFMFLLVTRLLVHIVLDSYIFSLPCREQNRHNPARLPSRIPCFARNL
jgi:hypothetical protein